MADLPNIGDYIRVGGVFWRVVDVFYGMPAQHASRQPPGYHMILTVEDPPVEEFAKPAETIEPIPVTTITRKVIPITSAKRWRKR